MIRTAVKNLLKVGGGGTIASLVFVIKYVE